MEQLSSEEIYECRVLHHAILLSSPLTAFMCLLARLRLPPFFKSSIRLKAIGQVVRIKTIELAWRLPYPKSHRNLFSTARSENRTSRPPAHRVPLMALDDVMVGNREYRVAHPND